MIVSIHHHWALIFDVLKVTIGLVGLWQIARILRRLRAIK